VYAAQLPRLPSRGFEVDVELVGCQITAEPLVRKGTLLMHQLTSKNEDPQVERTVSVRRGFPDLIYDVKSGTVPCPVNVGRSIHDALTGASARRMNRDVKPYQKTSFGEETGRPRQISKRVSILHVPEYP
jgi:hypothetical protein